MRILASILLIIALCFISCTKKAPLLQLSKNNIDLGRIAIHDTVNKTVFIKNIGNEFLKIERLESSCGCTIAKLNDSIISPNDSTYFDLEIIPENEGVFERSVVIRSNDEKIFHVLNINADVKKNN